MRGHLNHAHTDRPHFKRLARACTCISFGLLILTALSLLTSPFTQQVWTWDRFLHGGQDFETTVVLILTSLCLVLVMATVCRQGIKLLLTLWSQFLVRRYSAILLLSRIPATWF